MFKCRISPSLLCDILGRFGCHQAVYVSKHIAAALSSVYIFGECDFWVTPILLLTILSFFYHVTAEFFKFSSRWISMWTRGGDGQSCVLCAAASNIICIAWRILNWFSVSFLFPLCCYVCGVCVWSPSFLLVWFNIIDLVYWWCWRSSPTTLLIITTGNITKSHSNNLNIGQCCCFSIRYVNNLMMATEAKLCGKQMYTINVVVHNCVWHIFMYWLCFESRRNM